MTEEGAITLCHCEKSATKQSVPGCEAIVSRHAALAAEGLGLAMTEGAAHRNVAFPVTAMAQRGRGSLFSRDCFGPWSLAMTDGRSLPATLRSRLKAWASR